MTEKSSGRREQRSDAENAQPGVLPERLQSAFADAHIYVFSQDRELRYTGYFPEQSAGVLGASDEEALPLDEREALVALKRQVLKSGVPANLEIVYPLQGGPIKFALRIQPVVGSEGEIVGTTTIAVDLSRFCASEKDQRQTSEKLQDALLRYETALRGSNVTVYSQDRELRYTSISNPMYGRSIEQILGHTDEELLPSESRYAIIALKQSAMETGIAQDSEVSIKIDGGLRWQDLHIEPLRDASGAVVGVSCAAVDITERKEGEGHLRLLMRELTHRSKNLLAVIQAMARQTARHVGSIDAFLEQFSARLQALATSHDLLVQESWYGVPLFQLVRSQLGHYLDREGVQVTMDGPAVVLKPEAAQSLGLALHELATNAAKYGALSIPSGRVKIEWQQLPAQQGSAIEILWLEEGGPKVKAPRQRGFGSLVIENSLKRALDAEVEMTFSPTGLRCRIIIPLVHLSVGR